MVSKPLEAPWVIRGKSLVAHHRQLAQPGERCSYKSEVGGSKPSLPTQVKVTERLGIGLQNQLTLVRIQSLTLPFLGKRRYRMTAIKPGKNVTPNWTPAWTSVWEPIWSLLP